jgi:drug/metabolite transporter (DMT)-like permease
MSTRGWRLLFLVILSKPFSNLFLAWGMKNFPQALSPGHPLLFLRAMLEPLVSLGIATQIVWLLSRMALLGIADLSFVLPVTAVGYVLTTFLSRIFLHEDVPPARWVAVGLIFLGTALVTSTSRTEAKTAGFPE